MREFFSTHDQSRGEFSRDGRYGRGRSRNANGMGRNIFKGKISPLNKGVKIVIEMVLFMKIVGSEKAATMLQLQPLQSRLKKIAEGIKKRRGGPQNVVSK